MRLSLILLILLWSVTVPVYCKTHPKHHTHPKHPKHLKHVKHVNHHSNKTKCTHHHHHNVHNGTSNGSFDFTNWQLQTVENNTVVFVDPKTYSSPLFYHTPFGYLMTSEAGGATTKNSQFPRTELRDLKEWSMDGAYQYMNFSMSIMTNDKLIFGQIKSNPTPSGGPLKLWSENGKLWAQQGPHNGPTYPLGDHYTGQQFNVSIMAGFGEVSIRFNSVLVQFKSNQTTNYFKVGNYYHGSSKASVLLHSLFVKHTV